MTGLIFVGATWLLLRLVPAEWLSAESYLYQYGDYQGTAMPWVFFYGAILRPSFPLILLVGLAWVYTLINLVQTYIFYCSRIVLAWVEDGLLPELVGFLHPVIRSPLVAVLLVAMIAELGVVDAALNGALASQLNFVFFVVCTQLIPVLAILLLPFLRKDWFSVAPRLVQLKIGPLPVITLVGLVSFGYLVWLIVASVIYPIFGGVSLTTLLIFIVMFISGLVWFYGRTFYMKQQGVDLSPGLKKLPLE